MRGYGTNVVAGTSLRQGASHVHGIPVFSNCREAVLATGAQASVTFVGPLALLAAIREAVEAGIKYIVTPEEGMPVHDAVEAWHIAREAGVTWIGASTPGMAIPGELKLGFLPTASLIPGPLGLMSKSGTLSYEAGYRLAQRKLGQSVWVGVGGDVVKGTRFADLVPFFARDEQTRALLVLGEIGGSEEEEFAAALKTHNFNKPVFALIAGRTAPAGVTMGHAGALVNGNIGTFESKRAALSAAGVQVFRAIGDMVDEVCTCFGGEAAANRAAVHQEEPEA
jgi:succinyl-CoA synthetase alpha subunit